MTLAERVTLYQGAKALLLPVHWEEPFGIVMIEALATGTPVVAYRMGAIPEVIDPGKTGFVVENEVEMVEAVGKLDSIHRADCRRSVEARFTIAKMVEGYEEVYQKILGH